MHNPVVRFRVAALSLLIAAWLANLTCVGFIRQMLGSTFDSVAVPLLTANVIVALLGSIVLVFSLRAVMLPRRRPSQTRTATPSRALAPQDSSSSSPWAGADPLWEVPPVGASVYLREERKLLCVTISPTATGRVHALTERHPAKDEVFVEWPHIGVVMHKLSDLAGMYVLDGARASV